MIQYKPVMDLTQPLNEFYSERVAAREIFMRNVLDIEPLQAKMH